MTMLLTSTAASNAFQTSSDDDYSADNTLSIVGVCLAATALVVSSISILMQSNKSTTPLPEAAKEYAAGSLETPAQDMETKSLGSKMVA
jgi:hypothetical protein